MRPDDPPDTMSPHTNFVLIAFLAGIPQQNLKFHSAQPPLSVQNEEQHPQVPSFLHPATQKTARLKVSRRKTPLALHQGRCEGRLKDIQEPIHYDQNAFHRSLSGYQLTPPKH